MKENLPKNVKKRMIHVRISEDLHKRLRIRAAETDTMQDWVGLAIKKELDRQEAEKKKKPE